MSVTTSVVKVPTSRNKRERSIAASFVRFAASSKRIESVICHKHHSGHLLVALNESNLPVKAWTTNQAYMPIRAKRVSDKNELRDLIRHVLSPKRVYMNDATLLAPFTDNPFEVVFYSTTLLETMKSLNSGAFVGGSESVARNTPRTSNLDSIPSFESVKKLDNSITYKDYKTIYLS